MAGRVSVVEEQVLRQPCSRIADDGIVVRMTCVYIARCSDGTLYVGHTHDVIAREKIHNEGHGGRYTAKRHPIKVVYAESHDGPDAAIARERQLKRWTTAKKKR